MSVFLLWATALCFAIALSFSTATTSKKDTLFYISQIAVFGCLGFDDRFKVHEWVAWKLDTEDHYLLLLIGVLNVLCLWFLGRRFLFRPIVSIPLLVAGGFFAVMTLFDVFLPHDMVLRLSIEDLAKTWSSLAFLIFGWAVLKVHCAVTTRARIPPVLRTEATGTSVVASELGSGEGWIAVTAPSRLPGSKNRGYGEGISFTASGLIGQAF